jgi:predicted nucleic acid-binding Zn ribbon protein
MPNESSCIVCTKLLVNRRPQTRTCSGKCRTALYRMSRTKPVSLRLRLPKVQFDLLQHQADELGMMLNQLVIAKVMKPITSVGL